MNPPVNEHSQGLQEATFERYQSVAVWVVLWFGPLQYANQS
jgi:hypothetical protein